MMLSNFKKKKINEEFRRSQIAEKLKSKRIAFAFQKPTVQYNDINTTISRIYNYLKENKIIELIDDLKILNIFVFENVDDKQIISDLFKFSDENKTILQVLLFQESLKTMEELDPLIPDFITSILINVFSVDLDLSIFNGSLSNLIEVLMEYLVQSQYLKIKKQVKKQNIYRIIIYINFKINWLLGHIFINFPNQFEDDRKLKIVGILCNIFETYENELSYEFFYQTMWLLELFSADLLGDNVSISISSICGNIYKCFKKKIIQAKNENYFYFDDIFHFFINSMKNIIRQIESHSLFIDVLEMNEEMIEDIITILYGIPENNERSKDLSLIKKCLGILCSLSDGDDSLKEKLTNYNIELIILTSLKTEHSKTINQAFLFLEKILSSNSNIISNILNFKTINSLLRNWKINEEHIINCFCAAIRYGNDQIVFEVCNSNANIFLLMENIMETDILFGDRFKQKLQTMVKIFYFYNMKENNELFEEIKSTRFPLFLDNLYNKSLNINLNSIIESILNYLT